MSFLQQPADLVFRLKPGEVRGDDVLLDGLPVKEFDNPCRGQLTECLL